jgi:uncharacterized protein
MYTLRGKHVLITGASSGIGREMARVLAERGANLLMVAHPAESGALEAWAAELRDRFLVAAWTLPADLAGEDEPRRVHEFAQRVMPRIDVLVNNAGILSYGRFGEAPLEELERVFRVNARAPMILMRLVLPDMIERGEGRVLNTTSMGAFQPTAAQAVYGATKSFVQSLSEAAALELAGSGVAISTLNPGITDTAFLKGYRSDMLAHRWGVRTPPAVVARAAVRGICKGQPVIIPGWYNRLSQWLLWLVPRNCRKRMVYQAFRPRGR